MSKVGKVPVSIPKGVDVKVSGAVFHVNGEHGELSQSFRSDMVKVDVSNGTATVSRRGESKQYRAYQGLYRSLLANMVRGVSEQWIKSLVIKGLGYRGRLQGKKLVLDLGYSKPVEYGIPQGIEIEVPNQTEIVVRGADKQLVGQVAAKIRGFREPEPYKGKGVRYRGEQVRLKAGKLGGASAELGE